MKTSGLSQIAAVLGVFYLRTHRREFDSYKIEKHRKAA